MLRSLWTAASGMNAQQTNVDTIANNIANVNTVGFKSQETQFKSLLYQTLQEETTSFNGEIKPTSAQVGLGTRVASVNSTFTQGALLASENPMSCAVQGSGMFSVQGANGETYYTRDGDFGWAMTNEGTRMLTNNSGYPVMDINGQRIMLPDGVGTESVTVGTDGAIAYRGDDGNYVMTGQRIALFQFPNYTGLSHISSNLYAETDASGAPINEATTNLPVTRSSIAQGRLEGSNVDVADEMVELIMAQRAYELNSRAITTSDSMLETANGLKR